MNYRHAFHAGNFADVHKHVVLLTLLQHLHKKPAPFFVLDTHAGRGAYDLQSSASQRSDEWRGGIGRLHADESNPILNTYRSLANSTPETYCGSPLIAASMLRENDRAVFVERHTEEAAALREALGRRRHVSVLNEDGYATLKAHVPPKENRGLVLIDPPYESATEFDDVTGALRLSLGRWPNGVVCVWYPIKVGRFEERLHRVLTELGLKKLLLVTLSIRHADSPLGLNGSGIVIANPPWQLDDQLRELSPQLHRLLAPDGAGGVRVEWLVKE